MYGMIKFEDFEIRKETKYSKLSYYYENEKVEEYELRKYIKKIYCFECAKKIFSDYKIESLAFAYSDIVEIHIPENIKIIEKAAFNHCQKLIKVNMTNAIMNIQNNVFADCEKLKSIELSNNLINIELCTFYNCKDLENIILPESIINISNSAFSGCKNLKNIIIPENVINIGSCAFKMCKNLKDVILFLVCCPAADS